MNVKKIKLSYIFFFSVFLFIIKNIVIFNLTKPNNMKNIYLTICIMMSFIAVKAQEITGTITDENKEPMFGVSVIEKGTFNGTTTDFNGKFTLKPTKENPTILFKYIGYRDQEIKYEGKPIVLNLKVDEIGLDAVVVTASKRKERILDAPASVTLINKEKIENTAAVVIADNLKSVPGVDIMPTGLVSQNISVRGFNNIFSGSMLTMVDNRIGSVPSLKVNAFQLMPGSNEDIEKIEVVRGPGSALYGPNASDGVLHIITKSPLDMAPEYNTSTTLSFTGGSQSVWSPSVRHAHKFNDKIGFKVSGSYMQGHDFEYYDPREPSPGEKFVFGTVQDGTQFVLDPNRGVQTFDRDFFIRKYNIDGRIDYAINKDIDLIVSSGYANTKNLELTGLGAAQGENWGYLYAQARFRWKNLFFNYFLNASNSGDTYLISQISDSDSEPYQFQTLEDKSMMHGVQLQHNSKIKEMFDFTYGFDGIFTRPKSNGTIYGRYENQDNINQYGVYGQAEWHALKKLDILAALRFDYQDRIKEFMVSPRAAIVYKPNTRNTIRATYNRAFSSPSALVTALDLPKQFVPNGIIARGLGNPYGFNYNYGADGFAQYRSPYDNQWYGVQDNSKNYLVFQGATQSIGKILGTTLAGPTGADLGTALMTALTAGLVDVNSPVNNVDKVVTDFVTKKEFNYKTITDLKAIKSTTTQTVEVGYKGIIKDKLFLSADVYYTQINNFISPLSPASYRVQFDPSQLSGAIAPTIYANLQNVSPKFNATYNDILSGKLAGFENVNLDANNDGDVFAELMYLLAGNPADPNVNGYIYDFSAGTLAPNSDLVNSDLVLTYINLGKVDLWGSDIGATFQQSIKDTELSISGMFSFVNKDRIPLAGASNGYIGLNAPKYKSSIAVEAGNIANTGIGAGINWRWQDAFPANSALYIGDVYAANLLDLNISYRPNFSKGTMFTGSFYNITDNKFQRFPGTPYIGFYGMFKISHTFNYYVGKKKEAK